MPPFPDAVVASLSVDHSDRVLTMWVSRNEHELVASPNDPDYDFPDPMPYASGRDHPVSAVITVQDPDVSRTVTVESLSIDGATTQPMPSNQLLVVNSRAWWKPDGPEHNATLLDSDGKVVRTGCLGDGITHVRTTASGDIWVGYSDEGVYGNLGWGEPGAPMPIGSPGIRMFGADLTGLWAFPSEPAVIDDCYALTLAGDQVWAYYYSDFPIVEIKSGQVRSWTTSVPGAKHLLIDGNSAALIGGYGKNNARIITGSLGEALSNTKELRLAMPDGRPMPEGVTLASNAELLHVFHQHQWFQIALGELL